MAKNKIIYIEITSYSRFRPDVKISRLGGIHHSYDFEKIDDDFSERRFARISRMAVELNQRQSDEKV